MVRVEVGCKDLRSSTAILRSCSGENRPCNKPKQLSSQSCIFQPSCVGKTGGNPFSGKPLQKLQHHWQIRGINLAVPQLDQSNNSLRWQPTLWTAVASLPDCVTCRSYKASWTEGGTTEQLNVILAVLPVNGIMTLKVAGSGLLTKNLPGHTWPWPAFPQGFNNHTSQLGPLATGLALSC